MTNFWTTADLGILEALDLPPELHALQDAYHAQRRAWRETEQAYLTVALAMLKALEGPGFAALAAVERVVDTSNTDSEPRE